MAILLAIASFVNMMLLIAFAGDDSDMSKGKQRKEKNKVTFKHILSVPWVWMCLVLLAAGMIMAGWVGSTISQYMKDSFGTTSSQGGLAILIFSLAYGGVSFLSGFVLDKWIRPRHMCIIGLFLATVSSALYGPATILPMNPSKTLIFISTVPCGISVAFLLTAVPEDMLRTLRRRDVGVATDVSAYVAAIVQVSTAVFYTLGLFLGPFLTATVGLRTLSTYQAAFYLLLALIYLAGYLKTCRSEQQLDTATRSDQ